MSDWHEEIYDEIEKVAKSKASVPEGMAAIVEECARHRPHPDWERFATLDIAADLEHLRRWLLNAFSSPPAEQDEGL